jgi:osmotically-inducible protein OsmY
MTTRPPPDPHPAATDIEIAIGVTLGRNSRLHGHRITATAGPEGIVTLTGAVATQALRREVEISCWTVPGVLELHDRMVVGRSG